MGKKYFFFDIDGTLRTRNDYSIPLSAIEAIRRLKEAGHSVYIATGRGLYSARNMGRYVGIENVISDGGRVVYENGRMSYSQPLPDKDVMAVKQLAENNGLAIGYSNEFAIHSVSDQFSKAFFLDETIICSVKEKLDAKQLGPLYKLYLWADKEQIEQTPLLNRLEHHWLRERLCVIEHRHKDEGIAYLKEKHQLVKEDCVCFGDDINDISMFDFCGFSVCMQNGSEAAKQHADYIAEDICQDGIYKACLALGFIKP